MESLKVILTGASRGLGRAMAEHFASAGHTVFGCGRSGAELKSLQQDLGSAHRFSVVNVAEDQQVCEWAAEVLSDGRAPDLLINNAAVININSNLWNISASDFDQLFAVNVSGTANVIRHFVPAMVRRKQGVIVNFSSGWGRSVAPEVAPYCASKWAIEGLTKALAVELPKNMCAVALNPGIINTEMLQSCFGSGASQFPAPDEWAQVAVPYILGLTSKQSGTPVTVPI